MKSYVFEKGYIPKKAQNLVFPCVSISIFDPLCIAPIHLNRSCFNGVKSRALTLAKLQLLSFLGYTFDDVALVPQFKNVPSRTEPELDTWLTKNRKMGIPILCANMDTTISEELGDILIERGSIPIYHRFAEGFKGQEEWVKRFGQKTFISCGIGKEKLEEVRKLFDLGAAGVCIDVAHGHSAQMLRFIEEIKRSHPDKDIIAGNVCTPMAYQDLVNAGADGVKVGVGPGAACTTRRLQKNSGFHSSPMGEPERAKMWSSLWPQGQARS